MPERRGRRADVVQSVSGFSFLLGLVILGLPVVFLTPLDPGVVEVVAGVLVMGFSTYAARESYHARTPRVLAPATANAAIGVLLIIWAVAVALPVAHQAVLLVAALALLAASSWSARRALDARREREVRVRTRTT